MCIRDRFGVSYSTWLVAIVRIFVASRRPCEADAFATSSYETYFVPYPLSDEIFVRAAVNVVLPWSTWPIVPTFTCGFVRSNFALAIVVLPLRVNPKAHDFTLLIISSALDFGTSS